MVVSEGGRGRPMAVRREDTSTRSPGLTRAVRLANCVANLEAVGEEEEKEKKKKRGGLY